MRPSAPRPPRPAGSPSSSISSGSSGSFYRERERSPRTPLPPPAPLHAPGPVYPVPRTPMTDARRYCSLFSRRRVALPTPPYPSPPPRDVEPLEGTVDPAAELEGDPDEPYHEDIVYPASHEVYSSDTSYSSERESVSASSAPSSRHSSDDYSASGSIGYGEASSGSTSYCASDDDLVNRHFVGTFPWVLGVCGPFLEFSVFGNYLVISLLSSRQACKFWNFRVRFLVTSSAVGVIMTYRKLVCYNHCFRTLFNQKLYQETICNKEITVEVGFNLKHNAYPEAVSGRFQKRCHKVQPKYRVWDSGRSA
ncbi:hypothetical protein PIB30_079547 [Stylosanthes scabra]|uniref:Uncharacterized protein n=1 Tax=Stylosanthes scabra TaxID=79078 RepID=A0ABU6UR73_9FABA|nr:hypothetical protein [Stylosanthes scabra]